MGGLTRRVDALERVLLPPAARAAVVLTRVIVDPKRLGAPLVRAEVAGRVLRRRDDEDEAQSMARAQAVALAVDPGTSVVRIVAYSTTTGDEVAYGNA